MSTPVADLLIIQTELVAHLHTALASVVPKVHILTPAELASESKTPAHPVPAVNVVYMGHRFATDQGRQRTDGKALLMQQLYVAEVVTRNVATLGTGNAGLTGGTLAMRVLRAIMGKHLPSAASPMRLKPGPGPVYQSGNQYLPLAFDVDLLVLNP